MSYSILLLNSLLENVYIISVFHRQKALKALSEHLNKTNRPRIVGNVTLQKIKSQSPKKSHQSQNENFAVPDFITQNDPVQEAPKEQSIIDA